MSYDSQCNSKLLPGKHAFLMWALIIFVYICAFPLVRCRRVPKMHVENPNIRHVPRGPPPPHPGRLDKRMPEHEDHKEPDVGDTLPEEIAELSYEKYLREVTRILQSDPDFKKRMQNATREDVITGKLAEQLQFSSHSVRSLLDEAKRREVERLRGELRELERVKQNKGMVHPDFIKTIAAHMPVFKDPKDLTTFSTEDLHTLINSATNDLDEINRRRQEAFKQHEMTRELNRRKQMETLTPEERAQKEREFRAEREKLKQHARMPEPGHKANLEEVWEKQDHLDKETFNPKTFFKLHDMNEDGFLDEAELEALFVKEVDSMYTEAEKAQYDPEELEQLKEEEIARMREHVMVQVDTNKDRAVSFDEFMKFVQSPEFEKDEEWKGVPEEAEFSEEELQTFEKHLEKEAEALKRKKEKLREYKEKKMRENKFSTTTKSAQDDSHGAQHRRPPVASDIKYDVDGEIMMDLDARINEYDDVDYADFEG